ncbi:MAG: hypothetical protein PHQ34_07665 [Methanothrix sp.]|nr:hypothetical protein [Methanothrix sp.]
MIHIETWPSEALSSGTGRPGGAFKIPRCLRSFGVGGLRGKTIMHAG